MMASRRAKSSLPRKSARTGYWGRARPRSTTPFSTSAPQLSRFPSKNDSSFMVTPQRSVFSILPIIFENQAGRKPRAIKRRCRLVGIEQMRSVGRHVVGGRADMRLDQLYREIRIARDGGLHDCLVLAGLVARTRPEIGRQMPIALGAIEQLGANGEERRGAAGGDQRLVELAVGDLPLGVAQWMFGIALLDSLQSM